MNRVFVNFLIAVFRYEVLTIIVLFVLQLGSASKSNHNTSKFYLVALRDGDIQAAAVLAKDNRLKLVKQVRGFENVFLLEKLLDFDNNSSKRSEPVRKENLNGDERVLWATLQQPIKREKRDLLFYPFDEYFNEIDRFDGIDQPNFNDELWEKQWYMQTHFNKTGKIKLDLNVLPVYARGFTGKGVRVAVLDDGLEFDHEDLFENFDPEISWDCNNDSPDPLPNYSDFSNRHGTRCAGEIAMMANNNKCGVGIAYNARIGGIKLLDNVLYDFIEGMALGFAYDKVDIYSSSWGPTDNGISLDRPGGFASLALERGIKEGRGGKGSIYVWASGNGGSKNDNCNCDGYCTSIYTITVGSVTQRGTLPWYSEKCASLLTVTYSSGTLSDQMIVTTDLRNKCTVEHTGTSASAPLAAGIIALGLEANPNLTWRDVQHIIVRTAENRPLSNEDWGKNGAGRQYSNQFGFGLMNADAFVSLALQWKTVPPKTKEEIVGYEVSNGILNETKLKVFRQTAQVLFNYNKTVIKYLEHVEVKVNINSKVRGKLEITLTSPSGLLIPILEQRAHDNSTEGFNDWTFMSVASWSENPQGDWKMDIMDNDRDNNYIIVGECMLILHGTYIDPEYIQKNSLVNNYVDNSIS